MADAVGDFGRGVKQGRPPERRRPAAVANGTCAFCSYSFCVNPTKNPRRGPYCGANTPMPLPSRIW